MLGCILKEVKQLKQILLTIILFQIQQHAHKSTCIYLSAVHDTNSLKQTQRGQAIWLDERAKQIMEQQRERASEA